jgi:hypothetical protein
MMGLAITHSSFTSYKYHLSEIKAQCMAPAVLAISYLPSLFSDTEGRKLLEPVLECLKLLTKSSGIITAITSFGGSCYGDRLLASKADRVIRIEQPSKKAIRIVDDGIVTEYMSVASGQMRLTEFTDFDITEVNGVDVNGQNSLHFVSCLRKYFQYSEEHCIQRIRLHLTV